jgi:biopolymer transport protein ExbD
VTADPEIVDAGAAIVVIFAADGATAKVDGKSVAVAELSNAFKSANLELPFRFEGAATLPWITVMRALDAMKQRGGGSRGVTLAVTGDRARRTAPLFLPKAVSSASGGMGIMGPDGVVIDKFHALDISKDGAFFLDDKNVSGPLAPALASLGDLRGGGLAIRGDQNAPLGAIIDATALGQQNGAYVIFGSRIEPEAVPATR